MGVSVAAKVENYIKHRRMGEAITREQILCRVEGSEDALDQAISRAAKANQIQRIAPGLYARPKKSRFGPLPPSQSSILKALEAKHSAVIVPAGAKAVNELGISTQLPMKQVFVSNKRISEVQVGNQLITFKYRKALPEGVSKKVALLYSALSYLGKHEAKQYYSQLELFIATFSVKQNNQLQEIAQGKLSWMATMIGRR
ncbi:MAG: DUF6088 family protein [Amphritea sp.]